MTDNLSIWNAVSKTNPAHTKHVNQRGGFTAISAQYQILAATEQFGPIGIGWGYTTGTPIITEALFTVPVTLWHGSRENTFGPMLGCEEWKNKDGRVDSDAPKKAVTDGLTKLLSQLGFNADVFLGRFDDNKYVEQLRREFGGEPAVSEAKISDDQLTVIMDRMNSLRIPPAGLIAVANEKLGTSITKVSDLPATAFDSAVKWINSQTKAA
jgi:hypothetical protein